MITVRWNYAHTGGLDLTQVVIAATRGVETTQLDMLYGNLTDLFQMTLDVTAFTAGFQYTFTVTAYNEMGRGTAVCVPMTHLIGRMHFFLLSDVLASFPGSFHCFRRKGYKMHLPLLNPLILDVDSLLVPAPVTTPSTIQSFPSPCRHPPNS